MNEKHIKYPIEDRWTYLWLLLATALGIVSISIGNWVIPIAAWIGTIFSIRFMHGVRRAWVGYVLLGLSALVTAFIALPDFLGPMTVTIAIGAAIVTPLAPLADRLLGPRLPGFSATLVFPLVYTSMEFINNLTNPIGSYGTQSYAILDNLPLLQLASLTGLWGLSFLMGWFGSTVVWLWDRDFALPYLKRAIFIYGGIMLLVLFYGQARLWFAAAPTETVRVAGIVPVDFRGTHSDWVQAMNEDWPAFRQMSAERADIFFEETAREAEAGAQLVVWPEFGVTVPAEDEAALIARAQELTRREGFYLAMGLATMYTDDTPYEQKMVIVDPNGEVVLEHFKFGGAVFEEGRFTGDGILRTTVTPFGVLSGIICWDTDFPSAVLQAGRNDVDILLSPAAEYESVGPMHAQMATLRAIENGVSMVRIAYNGRSVITDPYGRVLALMDSSGEGQHVIVAQVPTAGVSTIYPIIGDLFGWLSIAGFAVLMLWGIVRHRREAAVAERGVLKPA